MLAGRTQDFACPPELGLELGDRPMVGRRTLDPLILVRIQVSQLRPLQAGILVSTFES